MKPELMQSVLEIATKPCQTVAEAGEELRQLRRMMAGIVEELGLQFAASGTHPFALWEDQKIVDRPRYEELIDQLGFIARQELIFGTHVHVAIDGPDRAIYVADGIRLFLPLVGQLAVLARRPHRDDVHPHARLPRLPARRRAAPLRDLGDLLATGSSR